MEGPIDIVTQYKKIKICMVNGQWSMVNGHQDIGPTYCEYILYLLPKYHCALTYYLLYPYYFLVSLIHTRHARIKPITTFKPVDLYFARSWFICFNIFSSRVQRSIIPSSFHLYNNILVSHLQKNHTTPAIKTQEHHQIQIQIQIQLLEKIKESIENKIQSAD